MSSLSQCHTQIAFARPPNGTTRLCDLILGPTSAARQEGHGRRRMFQQRRRQLEDANIEFYLPHVAKRAASPPIAASCASGIDPLHRSLLSISPFISLSAAAAKALYHENPRRKRRVEGSERKDYMSVSRQVTTRNFSARYQTVGSKE